MNRLLRQICAVAAFAALAAGCATRQQEPSVSVPSKAGVYKIGNPYQVGGVWYYPHEQPDYDETGIASWYGPNFHGHLTADGEIYDSGALTAAHPTLPMPVNVRVTNLDNGKSLVLRVNDRGPFVAGRIIDVSEQSSRLLGFHDAGTAKVRVTYLDRADLPSGRPQPPETVTPPEIANAVPAVSRAKVETGELPAISGTSVAAGAPVPAPVVQPAASVPVPVAKPTGQVSQVPVPAVTRLYVQVGAFGNYQNAQRLAARLGSGLKISAIQRSGLPFYRVRLGPFDRLSDADAALSRMNKLGSTDACIVVDQ